MRSPVRLGRALTKDRDARELARLVPGSFALKLLGGAATFLLNVVLARAVGAGGAGVYQLALSITIVCSTIARLGFDSAGMRFAADASGDRAKLGEMYRRSARLTGGLSIAATCALLLAAPVLASRVFAAPSLTDPLRVMALCILPLTQASVLVGFLRGVKRALVASAVETTIVPTISVLGTALLAPAFGVPAAAGINLFATIVAFAIAARAWRACTRSDDPSVGVRVGERALLSVSLPLFWVASMNLLMQFADVLLVGAFVGDRATGIYAAALRTATLTNAFLAAMTGVVAPQFAERWSAGDRAGLSRIAKRSTAIMTIVTLPPTIVMLAFPGFVMRLFGGEFTSGGTALRIIAVGQLLQTVVGAVGYLLAMTGHQRALRTIMVWAAAAFIALNLVLIPAHGIVGAAIAYAASLVGMNIAKAVTAWRRLGIVALPVRGWGRVR